MTEANHNRRMAHEHRFLCNEERREKAAETLIGELCREGRTVYYVNLRTRDGQLTGKTKESASFFTLVDYLRRNRYI